ncbi:MAG: winged helix-turn-helix transcriptional regulator, partial [Chroococcidiopsidaceae cyanobacterium CP_BM_RX_35]|nr:winged helix-turn-helix transcriptional regulator [Chroococcidiopsidaceae cyanobacterium CP_BM_RX_35]
ILDRSNLTRLVDRMEVAGLVCRKSCKSDRRGAFATLTETGQVMQQKMQPVYEQAVAKYFACHLNDAEIKVLTKALEQMQVIGTPPLYVGGESSDDCLPRSKRTRQLQ